MERDDWGRDPQVMRLRRIFARIEAAQKAFLHELNISPFDDRLRRWREGALSLFEKVWMLSARKGFSMDEEAVSEMYLRCLAHFLKLNRISVPSELLPSDEGINGLIGEALK